MWQSLIDIDVIYHIIVVEIWRRGSWYFFLRCIVLWLERRASATHPEYSYYLRGTLVFEVMDSQIISFTTSRNISNMSVIKIVVFRPRTFNTQLLPPSVDVEWSGSAVYVKETNFRGRTLWGRQCLTVLLSINLNRNEEVFQKFQGHLVMCNTGTVTHSKVWKSLHLVSDCNGHNDDMASFVQTKNRWCVTV